MINNESYRDIISNPICNITKYLDYGINGRLYDVNKVNYIPLISMIYTKLYLVIELGEIEDDCELTIEFDLYQLTNRNNNRELFDTTMSSNILYSRDITYCGGIAGIL